MLWLGSDGATLANSWATPLVCLLLNSTWEFWKLSWNNCMQGVIIQPSSLTSTHAWKESTTCCESTTKSMLSNLRFDTQCSVVCNPTASPIVTLHRGGNQSVLASTKSLASSLIHIPIPTQLREGEKEASILQLYLPLVGFPMESLLVCLAPDEVRLELCQLLFLMNCTVKIFACLNLLLP